MGFTKRVEARYSTAADAARPVPPVGKRSNRIEFAILTGDQIIGKRETWHSLEAPV